MTEEGPQGAQRRAVDGGRPYDRPEMMPAYPGVSLGKNQVLASNDTQRSEDQPIFRLFAML